MDAIANHTTTKNPMYRARFSDILKIDQHHVEAKLEWAEREGITEFFDRMLELLVDLGPETLVHDARLDSAAGRTEGQGRILGWDVRMRVHLAGLSFAQFVYAVSHLYRAQGPETYVHMRRAIESAGLAYLSKSKPELAEMYGSSDNHNLWKSTKTNDIFPVDNPLTKALNQMMKEASSRLHCNLKSVAGRIEEGFDDHGSAITYEFNIDLHDADDSLEHTWTLANYILTAMYHVSRLLAETLDVSEDSWYARLQAFKTDLDEFSSKVNTSISKNPVS